MEQQNRPIAAAFKAWLPYLWIICLGALIYAQTLSFGFTYLDDNQLIINNQHFISQLDNFPRIFQEDVFHSAFGGSYYRPLLALSFMIDAQFGGANPLPYHVSNLLLHLLVGCLLYAFLLKLGTRKDPALFLALLFIAHPVLTQAVAWVPGSNDTLLAVFFLLSFLAFIKFAESGRWLYGGLHLLLFFAALLTKENALALPLLCLLYIYCFRIKGWRWPRWLGIFFGWLLMIFPWLLLRQLALKTMIGNADYDIIKSLLANSPAAISYIGKVLFPINLSVLPIMRDLTPVYGLITLALLVILFIRSKGQQPAYIIFGACWFLLLLFPSFIRSQSSVADFAEHRLYLPLIGLIIVVLELDFVKKLDFGRKRAVIAALLVLALLSFLTVRHSFAFRDRLSFWRNAVESSPHYAFNHNNLGAMYYLDGQEERAAEEWQKTLQLNPNERLTHGNLGLIYMHAGRLREAETEFLKEIELNPFYDNVYFNLGLLYFHQGKVNAAAALWQKTLTINPDYLDAYYNLCIYYYLIKDYKKAAYYRDELVKRGGKAPPQLQNLPNGL